MPAEVKGATERWEQRCIFRSVISELDISERIQEANFAFRWRLTNEVDEFCTIIAERPRIVAKMNGKKNGKQIKDNKLSLAKQ